jgi:hypothetical protein
MFSKFFSEAIGFQTATNIPKGILPSSLAYSRLWKTNRCFPIGKDINQMIMADEENKFQKTKQLR